MHPEPHDFVRDIKDDHPEYFTGKKVLEVGSLNINGTIRTFFKDCDYTGIDLGVGKGVDKVCSIADFKEPGQYDVVISTEMLEHDKTWEASLKQMYENLKPGGLLILTCAGPDRAEHGTTITTPQDSPFTTDYYRNIAVEDFLSVLKGEFFKRYTIKYMRGKADLMFWGEKK